jgi:hypothetical protein
MSIEIKDEELASEFITILNLMRNCTMDALMEESIPCDDTHVMLVALALVQVGTELKDSVKEGEVPEGEDLDLFGQA